MHYLLVLLDQMKVSYGVIEQLSIQLGHWRAMYNDAVQKGDEVDQAFYLKQISENYKHTATHRAHIRRYTAEMKDIIANLGQTE